MEKISSLSNKIFGLINQNFARIRKSQICLHPPPLKHLLDNHCFAVTSQSFVGEANVNQRPRLILVVAFSSFRGATAILNRCVCFLKGSPAFHINSMHSFYTLYIHCCNISSPLGKIVARRVFSFRVNGTHNKRLDKRK